MDFLKSAFGLGVSTDEPAEPDDVLDVPGDTDSEDDEDSQYEADLAFDEKEDDAMSAQDDDGSVATG